MADKKQKKTYILKIDSDKCKGCELCIEFCPKDVLELSKNLNKKGSKYSVMARPDDCIGCRACVLMCPDVCIELFEVEQEDK
ncbi:MAG: ferredoxin family protein [Kiritimatiellae bacterium]|nr:ferredoxin family protein [Kiritimatiellia bacterium]